MHMVQHILLLDVAPILLILGLTKVILRPATRRLQRLERAAGPLAHPARAVVLYVAVMWVWHIPALYDAALEHPTVHALEHTFFMTAGVLYWWHLMSPIRSRTRLTGMGPSSTCSRPSCWSGSSASRSPSPPRRCTPSTRTSRRSGASIAGDDQALAGAIMALEQSIVMGIALAWLFVRALAESESDEQRAERYAAWQRNAPVPCRRLGTGA